MLFVFRRRLDAPRGRGSEVANRAFPPSYAPSAPQALTPEALRSRTSLAGPGGRKPQRRLPDALLFLPESQSRTTAAPPPLQRPWIHERPPHRRGRSAVWGWIAGVRGRGAERAIYARSVPAISPPLIPAKAGTGVFSPAGSTPAPDLQQKAWVPASAGMGAKGGRWRDPSSPLRKRANSAAPMRHGGAPLLTAMFHVEHYLPMQKDEKTRSRTSSVSTVPIT